MIRRLLVVMALLDAPVALIAAETAGAAAAPSTRPAETLTNRELAPDEAKAYRKELQTIAEVFSLASYREGARQTAAAARNQAIQEMELADEKARVLAERRARLTQRNLRKHPHRKGLVIAGHYHRVRDIERGRQQDKQSAAAESLRDRRQAGKLDANISALERPTISLGQASIHARYGQAKSAAASFANGVTVMPAAMDVLDLVEQPDLREEAANGIEEAFTRAMDALGDLEPGDAASILASQHAALQAAVKAPAAQGLAAYVGAAWEEIREGGQMTETQQLAAKYWTGEGARLKKERPELFAEEAPPSDSEPRAPRNQRGQRRGERRQR